MRAFHDTRDLAYRSPFGAIASGASTTLSLDVFDVSNATVTLRTWIDGIGEERYPMHALDLQPGSGNPARYQVSLTPDAPGVVWYQFIIRDNDSGRELRYGALDGRTGGTGRLVDWEPPSFLLVVYEDSEPSQPSLPAYLDGIENRAFEKAVSEFLHGETTARDLVEKIESLRESYPACTWGAVFNLLDTPYRTELLLRLSGQPATSQPVSDAELLQLDNRQRGLAKGRLWAASLLQTLAVDGALAKPPTNSPVSACDSASVEASGFEHSASLWGAIDKDCGDIVQNASDLRDSLPLFASSPLECFAVNDDVFGFWRRGDDGTAVCTLVNASLRHAYDIPLPMVGEAVSDALGGYGVPIESAQEACRRSPLEPADRYAIVHLYQLGTAVLYFHPCQRLECPMEPGVGVLSHITSIPAGKPSSKTVRHPGTLGAPAKKFIDWLSECGVRYWQVLPVNPTDECGSPYAGISAFAGNTLLLEENPAAKAGDIALLEESAEYRAFCEREASWLEPYACFMAIRQKYGAGKPWQSWPKKYRRFDPDIVNADEKLRSAADEWKRAQFEFDRQWRQLRSYANERGVQIIGDMPIYVSADSSDAWANPGIFQLGPDGKPEVVAGCPPDAFAEDGQIWGNPVYDWEALRADGYAWWMRRLERAFELYDWVRLDHFIGFARYYSVPAGEKATAGSFHRGPGIAFFERAREQFGQLPIIAEDLGSITPAIRALGAACGFPGMDIVQFVDGGDPLSGYHPRPEKIAYTGTHDNQTLFGFCADRYPSLDAAETADEIMRKVITCAAPVCVVPLQDLIGLDDEARMNVPGTTGGNWEWQAKPSEIAEASERTRSLVDLHEQSIVEAMERCNRIL